MCRYCATPSDVWAFDLLWRRARDDGKTHSAMAAVANQTRQMPWLKITAASATQGDFGGLVVVLFESEGADRYRSDNDWQTPVVLPATRCETNPVRLERTMRVVR